MKVWSSDTPSIIEWCPLVEGARIFASATTSSVTENPTLTLSKFNFLGLVPSTETCGTFSASSPYTTLSWSVHPSDLGIIAAGHKDGSISVYSPTKNSKLSTLSFHKSDISCLAFNPTQTNVLLSVSSDNDISVWDLSNPENAKHCSTGATNRVIQGTITNVAWHRKQSLSSFFALCDSTGLCVVWDLRSNHSTHSFADSGFKSELSDITFAPINSTLLATASSDSRNSIVSMWDLRNTTTPLKKLHGHTSGVVKLEWPSCDERVLLSAGKDGNIIAWNTETGEQLSTVFENSSAVTQLSWSPYFHGAVLTSNQTNTQLYSFADPANGATAKLPRPNYHLRKSGVDVAFDGRIFQYKDKNVHSFVHQEQIAEASDFVHFVEALEQNSMDDFVNEKIDNADNKTEKGLWEICKLAMNEETFKQNALTNLGIVSNTNFTEQLEPSSKPAQETDTQSSTSASLFGAPAEEDAAFVFGGSSSQQQNDESEIFNEVFSPFRVLPKKEKDEAGHIIAQALISGNLQAAIDCCFQAEKYAEALLIASCGPSDLLQRTRDRYIRHDNSTLGQLISHLSQEKLEKFVRYAKTKDWKEIFAVLCNYAKGDFEAHTEFLGRRLIAERNDYNAALICFVAAKKYDMVQQCLFQIYENVENKDTSSASVVLYVLEKLCAIAGTNADKVIAPIARTFLQHVIQSGHKDDAIRFIKAFPANSQLQELRAALLGGQMPSQQASQQQQRNVQQQQQQRNVQQQQPQQQYQPQQQPQQLYNPQQKQQQQQQPMNQQQGVYQPAQSGVFTPNARPQPGAYPAPPPKANGPPPPPPTGGSYGGQKVLPPGMYNQPQFISVQQPQMPQTQQQQQTPPPPVSVPQQGAGPQYGQQQMIPQQVPGYTPQISAPPPFTPSIVPPQMPQMAQPQPGTYGAPSYVAPPPPVGTYQPQQQQQQFTAAPPPAAKPSINVPPPAPAVSVPITPQIMPNVGGMGMPPTSINANGPPKIEPPPLAQPNINAPPPMTIVSPPVPLQMQNNMPQMGMGYGQQQQQQVRSMQQQQQQQAPPPPQKSPEATIDEVPDNYRQLANQLQALITSLESRPNMSQANKKALSDAAAKLPFTFAAFRDNIVSDELATDLTNFIQKLNGGDSVSANQIRKNSIIKHMNKCRDAVLVMNYISNAIK